MEKFKESIFGVSSLFMLLFLYLVQLNYFGNLNGFFSPMLEIIIVIASISAVISLISDSYVYIKNNDRSIISTIDTRLEKKKTCYKYANEIQETLKILLNCENLTYGGIASLNYILSNPINGFYIGLSTIYPNTNKSTKILIEEFIASTQLHKNSSIYEIKNFDKYLNEFNNIVNEQKN